MNKKDLRTVNGLILLDKPTQLSSNQALQHVKRLFKAKKAGHTGSLDVLASGLLPICLGEATKYARFLLQADKCYRFQAYLGKRTTTGDAEGDILAEKSIEHVSYQLFCDLLPKFYGDIEQQPPMFSALKHQGQPLYRLARKGITIPRPKRVVSIYELQLLNWNPPEVDLMMHCSKGTYVRTLVDDMGLALGCGAYVSRLRRTAVGHYHSQDMYTLEELGDIQDKAILPIAHMLSTYPSLLLSELEINCLYQGKPLTIDLQRLPSQDTDLQVVITVVLMNIAYDFVGIGQVDRRGCLTVVRLLAR